MSDEWPYRLRAAVTAPRGHKAFCSVAVGSASPSGTGRASRSRLDSSSPLGVAQVSRHSTVPLLHGTETLASLNTQHPVPRAAITPLVPAEVGVSGAEAMLSRLRRNAARTACDGRVSRLLHGDATTTATTGGQTPPPWAGGNHDTRRKGHHTGAARRSVLQEWRQSLYSESESESDNSD